MTKIPNSSKNLDVIKKLQAKGWAVFIQDGLYILKGVCLTQDGRDVKEVTIVAVSPTDAYVQQIGSDKYLLP